MASQGLFSIGGIASGLDTSGIIDQLLKLERQPLQRLVQRQDQLGQVKNAWGQVNTKLSTLRAATDKINRVDRFNSFMSVSSSNTDAVSVTSSGTTQTGNLSFTVDQLATRQQQSAGEVFTSRSESLGDRGLRIVGPDGVEHIFTATELGADATLDDLVKAVNAADTGVRASALQVEPDRFRLVLESEQTGTANAFEASALGGWADGAFTETFEARDARLTVGGISIERSSNTISDLVDGATITLKQTTATAVEVSSARDVDGAVKAVKGFTDALNGVLTTLQQLTAYDAERNKAGVLQGDAAARRLGDSLRQAISRPVDGLAGAEGLASTLGISFSRDGSLEVDEAEIRQAFTDDFAGTAARLGRAGSTTDSAGTFLNATSTATPGTYQVAVSKAADVARIVGAGFSPPGETEPKTFRVSGPGGRTVTVTITSSESTVSGAIQKINEALTTAGQNELRASEHDGQIMLESTRYGSASSFVVEEFDPDTGEVVDGGSVWGLEGTRAGVDVEGTIGGEAAIGAGRTLTAIAGAPNGLSLRIDGEPSDFDVTWSRGIIGQLGTALVQAEGINGTVSRARQAVDRQVAIYQTRIDGFEQRLISREATIRRQFVGMETMLGQLNAQGNWLGQQLAGLSGMNQQR